MGGTITYSPKVFVPLTQLCRDRCGYCTFAQPPSHDRAAYLSLDEVGDLAVSGASAGCHEALFTLGEFPEDRYSRASEWLAERGYRTTVDYLVASARHVLEISGLLPHANAGALTADDLLRLRAVSPSQGMMLESLRADLPAHRGAPDKAPERRLATIAAAGEARIPFTTGILVGIGEDRGDRERALTALADLHERYGHIQEVIVQNFLPKQGTAMRDHPACPEDVHLDAIAMARAILPLDVPVQAPPNLAADITALLDAGVRDLGGISPITIDHVNPERPWPHIEVLRSRVHAWGGELVPRLTVYPRYVRERDEWIDPDLHFAVLDRCDAEGFAREDPGAIFPERYQPAPHAGTGADVIQVGRRSRSWAAGSDVLPPSLLPGAAHRSTAVAEVLDGVAAGASPGEGELRTLFSARGRDVAAIAEFADGLRSAVNGDLVTFVNNRNINYTNVCTFKCTFCGFSKGPLSLNLRGTPYLLSDDEIVARVHDAVERGATEVCLQGGIHPSFDGEYYLRVIRAVHAAEPDIHIHGFTALEVLEGARRLGMHLEEYLRALRDAGLKSLPGTAAEILDDQVRAILCPDKVTSEEWLHVHETAHGLGLRSNVTIMFGSIEEPDSWVTHLLRTRKVQERTGGFTEFVPLPFVHMAAPMYLKQRARRGPTWREVVLMHAIGRIAYHGFISNIQASWVKLGVTGAQQLLRAGVNDLGGTLIDENISRAAGASHGSGLTVDDFLAVTQPLGRQLRQRTTLYDLCDSRTVPMAG